MLSSVEGKTYLDSHTVREKWIWGTLSWMKENPIESIAKKGYRGDLLIAYSAKNEKCENILTFDKKASMHGFFELVLSSYACVSQCRLLYQSRRYAIIPCLIQTN